MTEQTATTSGTTIKGTRTGVVTSKRSAKTIHVAFDTLAKNAKYGKYVRRRTRLAVHDPANQAGPGDVVEVAPCRRLSKTKSWRLLRIVRRAKLTVEPSQEARA